MILLLTGSLSYSQLNVSNVTRDFTQSGINTSGDTTYLMNFDVLLKDTINLKKVNISIGSTYKGNDIYSGTYYFYPENGETTDEELSREFMKISGKSILVQPGRFFYRVEAVDFQNNTSTPYNKQI